MKCLIIGKKQLISIGSVLLIVLFAAVCAAGMLIKAQAGGAREAGAAASARPILSVERPDKKLSFTFTVAEGDDPGKILPILQKYNVKAAFFLTADWAASHPGQTAELTAAGQEVGCLIDNTDEADRAAERIAYGCQRIAAAGGGEVKLFRTADGQWSGALMEATPAGSVQLGWSLDGGDGELDSSMQGIADRVLTGAGSGVIVRLGCGGKYTAAALPYILENLIGKGYEPVVPSALLLPEPYTVDETGRQKAK